MSDVNLPLVSKCMDFCQALASQGQTFHFSLNMGPTFSFSLDTRGKAMKSPVKKKESPSTQRRNARRREEFLSKKRQTSSPVDSTMEQATASLFPCDHCDYTNVSKRGWGNIWGWSMENPSWTLSYNPLLSPLPRSSENQQVTAMHWLCPLLETQPGSSLATIVIKTCLQTTSVQRTVVADVMKYLVVTKNWPITKELFIQTCVTYASKSLLMKIPFWHTFGKNTWTIDFS